jgi:bacterioferritin
MNKKVIDVLNKGRSRELSAILQYMAQHYELENDDFGKLAKIIKHTAIVEMKHAEKFGERILFLGGVPTSKPDMDAKKGQDIAGMIATDITLEEQAIDLYNSASALCAAEQDMVSKQIFDELVKEETDHLDEFQNIKDHVAKLGAAYLATLTGSAGD